MNTALDADAADLIRIISEMRCELPHAANGQPIAPSDPRAAQILKDMGQGRSQEVQRLLTVLRCNLRDGVHRTRVRAFAVRLLAIIDAAEGPAPRQVVITSLNRRETRAAAALDLAQLDAERALATPCPNDDVAALEALAQHSATVAQLASELTTAAHQTIAASRLPARRRITLHA